MPLDKIKDVEEYAETHKSSVLHIKNNPVACILEKNSKNILKFKSIENSFKIKASLRGFLNKHEEIGLIIGCKFKIQVNEQLFEYTVYPSTDFIDSVIFNEMIFKFGLISLQTILQVN